MGDITLPKEPKKGEIVNLISSGMLNQQVDNHVVSGGTKQVEETIKSIQLDSEGKEREVIEVRRTNIPFFNVLLADGSIKKLLNKEVN
jgi:malonyl CoA-acyl carrier protein transacylase